MTTWSPSLPKRQRDWPSEVDILGLVAAATGLRLFIKLCGEIDTDDLPLDDPAVYQLLSEDTIGNCFSESDGLRRCRRQPGRFEELIAVIALYDPAGQRDGGGFY